MRNDQLRGSSKRGKEPGVKKEVPVDMGRPAFGEEKEVMFDLH